MGKALEIALMPCFQLRTWSVCLLAVLSLVATSFAASDDDLPIPDAKTAAEINALIKDLGDESYATREVATEKLLTYGLPALKIVEEGAKDPDREIRYRCERVRVMLREIDLQRRLEAFAADIKGEKDHGLPAWDRFAEQHGSTVEARQWFVEIFRAEPDLLKALQIDSKQAADVMNTRVFQMIQMQQAQQPIGASNIVALLFAAGDKEISLSDITQQYLYNFCYQQSFRDAITGGAAGKKLVVRSLLGRYMLRSEGSIAYQALHVGMQFEMKESLDVARKVVKLRGAGNLHTLQYALPAMAKLGSVEDLPEMEELLDEKTVLFNFQNNNQPRIECQVRDFALVSILHLLAKDKEPLKGTSLEGGDLQAFGFDRLEPNPQLLYNPQSIGFTGDDKRREVFKKWTELRSKLKDKLPPEKKAEDARQDGAEKNAEKKRNAEKK
jgi:hypothetical protein